MPLRVSIELIASRRPKKAATTALTPVLGALAPSRPLHVLDLRWHAGPGTQVAPWTFAGVATAAKASGLAVEWETLEFSAERRAGSRRGDGLVATNLPGSRRARSVPRRWFGRHLCLAIPCGARDPTNARGTGPIESALRGLDRHIGGPPRSECAAVAARMLATVFASVTVVVDGSWWADISSETGAARSLVALERCLAISVDRPDPAWARLALQTFDPWLAHKLKLGGRGRSHEHSVRSAGTGDSATWPRVPAIEAPTGGPDRSLRSRALEALWKPGRGHARLGPAVPGELGRVWHAWSAADLTHAARPPEEPA